MVTKCVAGGGADRENALVGVADGVVEGEHRGPGAGGLRRHGRDRRSTETDPLRGNHGDEDRWKGGGGEAPGREAAVQWLRLGPVEAVPPMQRRRRGPRGGGGHPPAEGAADTGGGGKGEGRRASELTGGLGAHHALEKSGDF